MPSRSRPDRHRDLPAAPPADPTAAAADVRRFAELLRAKEANERESAAAERRRAAADRERLDAERAQLRLLDDARSAKERAARRLKEVRAGRSSNAAVAEAEAAYKVALADLLAAESGERPSWAPAVSTPAPDESQPDDEAQPAGEAQPDGDAAEGAPDAEAVGSDG